MSVILRVKDKNELFLRWRHLNGFNFEDDLLFATAIRALRDGLILFVVEGGKTTSVCVATREKMGVVKLHTLPQANGENQGKQCLELVKKWAKENELKEVRVATNSLSGASFRYFEKTLGMRRRYVVFGVTI